MHYLFAFLAGTVLSGAATGFLAYRYGKKAAAVVTAVKVAVKQP